MPEKVSIELLRKYPHMLKNDIIIWEKFLPHHIDYWEKFTYDVHVGEGVNINPEWPENIQRSATYLTTKRIDIVATKPGEIWIIEVKPYASMNALGQLIAYKLLYEKKFNPTERIYLAVVTDKLAVDLIEVYEHYGIKVFEVGEIEGLRE